MSRIFKKQCCYFGIAMALQVHFNQSDSKYLKKIDDCLDI